MWGPKWRLEKLLPVVETIRALPYLSSPAHFPASLGVWLTLCLGPGQWNGDKSKEPLLDLISKISRIVFYVLCLLFSIFREVMPGWTWNCRLAEQNRNSLGSWVIAHRRATWPSLNCDMNKNKPLCTKLLIYWDLFILVA